MVVEGEVLSRERYGKKGKGLYGTGGTVERITEPKMLWDTD